MFDAIGRDYIALGFALSQHIDGYVDAYTGPSNLRDAALSQAPLPPNALVERAEGLLQALAAADYPPRRRAYLTKQVQAMAAACRRLAGADPDYRSEVEQHFDIVPRLTDEAVFEAAREELETLLPGNGPVHERMLAWQRGFEIAPAVAQRMLDVIVPELRQRTQAWFPLPAAERVEFRMVSDQPWSGYNWYMGNYHSIVDLNTDLPIRANGLTHLVAHEAYPGHHTEHCLKEAGLLEQRGWAEHSIFLINTPECLIAEGIANCGASVVFGPGDLARWQAEHLYPLAGIDGDPEREQRISTAATALAGVRGNAALLLHADQRPEAEVIAYLMRYGLTSEERARQQLRFLATPLWRTYVFTYFYGEQLITEWLERGNRQERFATLLNEQITPSLLERWVLDERASCGIGG